MISCGGGDDDSVDGTILEVLAGNYLCTERTNYRYFNPAFLKSKQLRWVWHPDMEVMGGLLKTCAYAQDDERRTLPVENRFVPYNIMSNSPVPCRDTPVRAEMYEETEDILVIEYDVPNILRGFNGNLIGGGSRSKLILTLDRDNYQVLAKMGIAGYDIDSSSIIESDYEPYFNFIFDIEPLNENLDVYDCNKNYTLERTP